MCAGVRRMLRSMQRFVLLGALLSFTAAFAAAQNPSKDAGSPPRLEPRGSVAANRPTENQSQGAGLPRLRSGQVPAGATTAPAPAGAQAPISATIDFDKLSGEAAGWLAGLLAINTTNPPGNELVAAKFIAAILDKEGIPAEVIESTPGRGILIARLQAGALRDPSRALLLLAHMDVVGVDRAKWTEEPFGGAVKDGAIWGRGSIDDKGLLVANLAAFIALKRAGGRLERDLIFLATSDEEESGEAGIDFAVRNHWDKIAAGFSLNEGGRMFVQDGRVVYVGVQASEKVPVNIEIIATGTAGHASIPRKDNAVVHLTAAVAKIGAYEAPVQLNSVTRRTFEKLADLETPETSKWIHALLEQPERTDHAAKILSDANPVWNAMLRTTVVPTMLRGGVRANVIPSEARATANIRLLPGELATPLIAALEKAVNDPQVRIQALATLRQTAPPSSLDTEFFHVIEQVTMNFFPGSVVVPQMSTWATDSATLRLRQVQAYGITPFPLTEEEIGRMHSDDERLPVAAFRKGVEYTYKIVEAFVKTK
jgi:acetylornithine deacetylase/succinyl-diaminopimelate desuccinylase-like protein